MKARNHRVKEEVKKIRTLLSNPVNRELKLIKNKHRRVFTSVNGVSEIVEENSGFDG